MTKEEMTIPSQKEVDDLKKRITELEKTFELHKKNHEQMINECITEWRRNVVRQLK